MANRVKVAFVVACSVLLAQVGQAAERTTTVLLSDLHLNVDASYSWLVGHAGDLAAFLTEVDGREDVADVVILGDLVDLWVTPAKSAPHTAADVIAASTNAGPVAALRELCANPALTVTYVVGNHDMLAFEDPTREALETAFPGLRVVAEEPGLGAWTKDDVVWAEHGHRYTMFNAPDTWSRAGSHLPLGYFISRLAATRSARTGQVVTTLEVLDDFVKDPGATGGPRAGNRRLGVFSDAVVAGVFDAVAAWCEVWPWERFAMDDTDGFLTDPRVTTVGKTYDQIYSKWPARQDRVSPVEAVWADVGHLGSAANLLLEMPAHVDDAYPFTPRIVVFGHTHEAAFQYHSGEVDSVYLNTGTWVDSKPMTWGEIEVTQGAGGERFYTVSLHFLGEPGPRQSATLKVPAH